MTVVVGFIPTKHGEAALTAGLAEARLRDTDLIVVNATRGDALVDPRYLGAAAVDALSERLDAETDVASTVRQALGPDVAAEILRVADEVDAQLIVIGVRPRSPVGKLVTGSVAQEVLLDASCPVLAVKAP